MLFTTTGGTRIVIGTKITYLMTINGRPMVPCLRAMTAMAVA
jgi:hypothetical protein